MDVYECARSRVEVRQFKSDPLPEPVLKRILEAGRFAPSQRNRQPWHFIVIDDRELLRQIGAAASSGPFIADAPLAIAIAMEQAKLPQVDAARAAQCMMLVAWSEGVGSCWVHGIDRDKVKGLLGIPAQMELITVIPFGYPTDEAKAVRKRRKPLSEIVHLNRFHQRMRLASGG